MSSKLSDLIENVFGEEYADVVEKKDFISFEIWDSLTYVSLVVSIENTFQIKLTKEEIRMLTSVANIKSILEKRGIDANA